MCSPSLWAVQERFLLTGGGKGFQHDSTDWLTSSLRGFSRLKKISLSCLSHNIWEALYNSNLIQTWNLRSCEGIAGCFIQSWTSGTSFILGDKATWRGFLLAWLFIFLIPPVHLTAVEMNMEYTFTWRIDRITSIHLYQFDQELNATCDMNSTLGSVVPLVMFLFSAAWDNSWSS